MPLSEVAAAISEAASEAAEAAKETVEATAAEIKESVAGAVSEAVESGADGVAAHTGFPTMEEFMQETRLQISESDRVGMSSLTDRVGKRLAADGRFSESGWQSLDAEGRKGLLDDMLDTIAEEMQLPENIRGPLKIRVADLGNDPDGNKILGGTSCFVHIDESGALALDPDATPTVWIDSSVLEGSFEDAMRTVYDGSVRVMQESSSVGASAEPVERATVNRWREELKEYCASEPPSDGTMGRMSEYTDEFARAWDDELMRAFNGENVEGSIERPSLEDTTVSEEVEDESRLKTLERLHNVEEWIGEINPNYDPFDVNSPYCTNCGSCAYAVYRRLLGETDAVASAVNIPYNSQMEALTGMRQVPMSPEAIKQYLLEQGSGAHAIIGIDRAYGAGHWFNAANIDGRIVAIDGQTGEVVDWPPDYGDVVNWEISI